LGRLYTKNTSNYTSLGVNKLNPYLTGASAISLSCWFEPLSLTTGGGDNYLISVPIQNGGQGPGLNITGASSQLRISGRSKSTDAFANAPGVTTITTGIWWHLGGWMDFGANRIQNIVNGANNGGQGVVTFGSTTYAPSAVTTGLDMIGGQANTNIGSMTTAQQLSGYLADVAIWTCRLTPAEWAALGKGVSPGKIRPNALAGFWQMEGSGNLIPDGGWYARKLLVTGSIPTAPDPPRPGRPLRRPTWRNMVYFPLPPTAAATWPHGVHQPVPVPTKFRRGRGLVQWFAPVGNPAAGMTWPKGTFRPATFRGPFRRGKAVTQPGTRFPNPPGITWPQGTIQPAALRTPFRRGRARLQPGAPLGPPAPHVTWPAGTSAPVTRRVPFRRGKSAIGSYALPTPGAGSLRVQGRWNTSHAANNTLLTGQTACSLSFFLRVNSITSYQTGGAAHDYIVKGGLSITQHVNAAILGTNCNGTAALNAAFNQTYGQIVHIALSWNGGGSPLQEWFVNGVKLASQTVAGDTTLVGSNKLLLGFDGTDCYPDVSMSDVAVWNGYALTASEALNLATGVMTPATVSTPASAWWTLAGTPGLAALPAGDLAFANHIAGGTAYPFAAAVSGSFAGAPSLSGSAVYSSEVLTAALPVVADAYIDRSGLLAYFLFGSPYATFSISPAGVGLYGKALLSTTITAGGSGYTAPVATISGGSPVPGAVTGVSIATSGEGYVSAPTVVFDNTGTGGSGAAAVAVISAHIASVTITNGGSGYQSTPAVTITDTGNTGSLATATATVTGGVVTSVTVTAPGFGYTSPVVTFTGGSPTVAATGTPVTSLGVTSIAITAGGSGYASAPAVSFSGGSPTTPATATALIQAFVPAVLGPPIMVGGVIRGVPVFSPGTGYTTAPTITITDANGTGATVRANLGGTLMPVTSTAALPTVSVNGSAVLLNSGIAYCTVTAAGTLYTSAPAVSFTGGGGSGATAIATIGGGKVTGIVMTAPGTGYVSTPTVVFDNTGTGGSGAAAMAVKSAPFWSSSSANPWIAYQLAIGGVASVQVQAGGSGYSGATTASVSGGNPTVAAVLGAVTIVSGAITAIAVTSAGSGYLSAPTITISDSGGGTGALAVPLMSGAAATDAVTFSAPVGWASIASGSAGASAAGTVMGNYAGVNEPQFIANPGALALGGVMNSLPGAPFEGCNLAANWLKRAGQWNGPGATQDATGNLLTLTPGGAGVTTIFNNVTGNGLDNQDIPTPAGPTVVFTGGGGSGATATCTIVAGVITAVTVQNAGTGYTSDPTVSFMGGGGWGATAHVTRSGTTIGSVTVDTGGHAYMDGLWSVQYDDLADSDGSVVTLQETTSHSIITQVSTSAGTSNGAGGHTGVTTQWYVQLKPTTTSWNIELQLNIKQGGGGSGTNHITNLEVFGPNNTPDRTDPLAPDQNLVSRFTTPGGRAPAALRFVDTTLNFQGSSQIVDASDLRSDSSFSWNIPGGSQPALSVTSIRPYNVGTSPNVWTSQNLPGSIQLGGGPTPYAFQPPNAGWINIFGPTDTRYCAEMVFSGPHGFKTGQQFVTNATAPLVIAVNDGTFPTSWANLRNFTISSNLFVTSATTAAFVYITNAGVIHSNSGLVNPDGSPNPSGINTLPYEQTTGSVVKVVVGGTLTGYTAPLITFADSGSGSGATGVVVMSGGVITGVRLTAGGSNYTGPTAQIVDSGGGTGSGATATVTAASGFPYPVFNGLPEQGIVPYTAIGKLTSQLPSCGTWVNIPHAATDACVDAIAAKIRDCTVPGALVWLEYTNEHWNNGGGQWVWMIAMGKLVPPSFAPGISGPLSRDAMYALRAGQVYRRFETVFAAAGRSSDLRRVYGTWMSNGVATTTYNMIAFLNPYNASNPGAPFQADAFAGDTYVDAPNDGPYIAAAAAVMATNSTSIMYQSPWPWTWPMYHGFTKHNLLYRTDFNGSGLLGQPAGFYANQLQAIKQYNLVNGQQPPSLVAYEGGIENAVPAGVSTGGAVNMRIGMEHDYFFHPFMRESQTASQMALQASGLTMALHYKTISPRGGVITGIQLWCLSTWTGQQPGIGDGSDGKPVNLLWKDDGKAHDLQNVAPALLAWQDWQSVSGAVPGFSIGGGSFVLTGGSAALVAPITPLSTVHGSFVLTGGAATLPATFSMTAGGGSFVLTGDAASLVATFSLSVAGGSFQVTGGATTLMATGSVTAGGGSFVLTGGSAALVATDSLPAVGGSFAVTGGGVSLMVTASLTAGTGSFTLAGGGISTDGDLAADGGSFVTTGGDAALAVTFPVTLSAESGLFFVTVGDAKLLVSGAGVAAPARRWYPGMRRR
jgi:hypothetical protein